jgi:hypothetical protein
MLKGRRSSTPSQNKEKEKSKDKSSKKQQRSASTSAIKINNNNNNSLNSNSSVSLSNSLPNNGENYDQSNVDNYANNNAETSETAGQQQQQHWSDFVCETVLLVLNEGGGLHFEVVGGADEGKFPYVGPLHSSAEESGVTIQSLSPSGTQQIK